MAGSGGIYRVEWLVDPECLEFGLVRLCNVCCDVLNISKVRHLRDVD